MLVKSGLQGKNLQLSARDVLGNTLDPVKVLSSTTIRESTKLILVYIV